jgi:hypothetical protein
VRSTKPACSTKSRSPYRAISRGPGQLLALREGGVPAGVNARVGRAKQTVDARIAKTAADMIVPFGCLEELLTIYDREFDRRGLDAAVCTPFPTGLHPNVIPRSMADVESARRRSCRSAR